jgi:phage terminase large subunit-like protein
VQKATVQPDTKIDDLIAALEAAMLFQTEQEQDKTKTLIEALEVSKIFQL